jgi:hypothetical protein
MILLDKLKQKGLEKYAFLGGANLETIVFLVKSGLIKKEDIMEPKQYALSIWERFKDRYALDELSK